MRKTLLGTVVCLALAMVLAVPCCAAEDEVARRKAELDRQRLLAAAHYENDDFKGAVAVLRRCLELAPESAGDAFNLALTLMRGDEHEEALAVLDRIVARTQAFDRVEQLDPDLVGVDYVRGIIFKRLGRFAEAAASLHRVIERDPGCFGAYYNLGVCYKSLEDWDQARQAFAQAVEVNPEDPSAHYQMIIVARRLSDMDLAARHAEIFERVKDTVDESQKTVEALERSRYSELLAVRPYGSDLPPRPRAELRFHDVTAGSGLAAAVSTEETEPAEAPRRLTFSPYDEAEVLRSWIPMVAGAVSLGDVDNDGDLDLYQVVCTADPAGSGNHLWLNDGNGRFSEVTEAFRVGDTGCGRDAVFGDLDNDGHDDLYVVNAGANVLYHNLGDGAFRATAPAGQLAVSLLEGVELPERYAIEVELQPLGASDKGTFRNGFVVVGFHDADDLVLAGPDLEEGCWLIGCHRDGSWQELARQEAALSGSSTITMRVEVDGDTLTLVPWASEVETPLHATVQSNGRVGMAVRGGTARFDDLRLVDRAAGTLLLYAGFGDGRSDGCRVVSGDWQVVDWRFADVSHQARVDEPLLGHTAVLVDYDHDNDLDIFIANEIEPDRGSNASVRPGAPPEAEQVVVPDDLPGQVNTMLRNNGNGTFSDLTDAAGLLVDLAQSLAVLAADLDGDSDTDLLIANRDTPSRLFLNQRLGSFRAAATDVLEPAIRADARAVAAADLDHDTRLDIVVAVGDGLLRYQYDGHGRFAGTPITSDQDLLDGGIGSIEIIDGNNDGWSDLLLLAEDGSRLLLLAGSGGGSFTDITASSGLAALVQPLGTLQDLAVGDLDRDGDQDIVVLASSASGGSLHLLENRGGNRSGWIVVRPLGQKVNRSGYGARVELAAGGHYQQQVVHDGPLFFGLGDLPGIDVVRVTWPNGVTQNVIDPGINRVVAIEEYVKVSASCGFLWSDNGDGFELVNEILGIGPLGAPMAPGVFHQPDSTELTHIAADQLVARNGVYELRLVEELRELTFADRITLRVVDHPAGLEIVPNEYFTAPPFPEDRIYALAEVRPPASVVGSDGRDLLPEVRDRDGRFPSFPLVPAYDGLAELHSLTIDLGEPAEATAGELLLLLLDGWVYWPDAGTTMAMAQDPRYQLLPPSLEVRGVDGSWRTLVPALGLPTSKGLVVPVDLSGLLAPGERVVRITTSMCLYWDRIAVATGDRIADCRVSELPVQQGELRYRGFSRMDRDLHGYERFVYGEASLTGSWSPPSGKLTRYGEVTALLHEADDRYVIFGPGDELQLLFDAGSLPPLPAGWQREWVFFADGWVKDGDLSTEHSETVGPLPFHAMSGYPYPEHEHYPQTPEHQEYQRQYNTRPAVATVGTLP